LLHRQRRRVHRQRHSREARRADHAGLAEIDITPERYGGRSRGRFTTIPSEIGRQQHLRGRQADAYQAQRYEGADIGRAAEGRGELTAQNRAGQAAGHAARGDDGHGGGALFRPTRGVQCREPVVLAECAEYPQQERP
jgi:hypothetical protein